MVSNLFFGVDLCVCKVANQPVYFSLSTEEIYDYAFNETEEEASSPDITDETIDWIFDFFDEPGKYFDRP